MADAPLPSQGEAAAPPPQSDALVLSPGFRLFLALNLLLLAAYRGLSSAPLRAPVTLHSTGAGTPTSSCAAGGLEVSQLFASDMVLQRDGAARVWGWAPLGCAVSALLEAEAGDAAPAWGEVELDGRGLWVATLPARPGALARHRLTLRTPAGDALVLERVLFGEVLGCMGQSNIARQGMGSLAFALTQSPEVLEATAGVRAAAERDALPVRYLGLGPTLGYPDLWHSGAEGLQDLPRAPGLPWMDAFTLTDTVLANCSSTCWLMGREVAQRLGGAVPVGLIDAAVGGSAIQAWSSPRGLAACSAPPGAPQDFVSWGPGSSGALYNALVAPLLVGPLALAGIAWYNGESNSLYQQAPYYACALPQLIADYREALRQPALWFGVVELHPFFIYDVASRPTAEVRAAQGAAAARLPRVTLVPAVDLGDALNNLHPLGMAKVRVAQRLGLAHALAAAGEHSMGPLYAQGMRVGVDEGEGAAGAAGACPLRVRIDFAPGSVRGGGLELRGWEAASVSTRCPEAEGVNLQFCDWFAVQDSTGAWHNASAALSSDAQALELSVAACSAGLAPVATRSGWSGWPVVQLYDRAGLPAHPWAPTPLGAAKQ